MYARSKCQIMLGCLALVVFLPVPVQADPMHQPAPQINGYDLINAVNALRAAYGLPPYSINSTLMFTAQNQADFMAASGQVTHSGPGGITLTQRLLAAGYPLAGDLSLGGFRAENITSGSETMAAESAIQGWMRDAPHQNTMLSPNLTEIGAGVAIANGRAYLVIDAARPTNAPNPPLDATSVVGSGTIVPAVEAPIVPVTLSTPNASGEVLHEVQYGQSLWQLAISYGVRIDDIKRLNGLFDNSIFPGNILLIKLVPTAAPSPLTETAVATITPHPTMAATVIPVFVAHLTATSMPPAVQDSTSRMSWAIGIIALALFGAGMFAWLGGRSNHSKNR